MVIQHLADRVEPVDSMSPLVSIAGNTAYDLVFSGYAPSFGDDKVEALAETLSAFLKAAGIPVDEAGSAAHFAKMRAQDAELQAQANADRNE